MSGIAGIFGAKNDKKKMYVMLDKMKHRGTADWVSLSGKDGFLSAHLSPYDDDSQLFTNEKNSTCITFSGRIYNHHQLRQMLMQKYEFFGNTDAELVLYLYQEKGSECVRMLDGAFAFAIFDVNQGLFLARDPLGIKPLYASKTGENLYFASEMKALAETVPDFSEFPIGTYYQSDSGYHRYFDFWENEDARKIDRIEDAITEIKEYLGKAVQKRLETELPVGVYLSGGLDSGIIAALTAQEMPGVDSFAVGMDGSEDIKHARLCADFLGTTHHEYIYGLDEMLEILPQVIYHLESYDAALVRSSVANYLLARLAGENVNVVFSGEGADELFCGYQYLQDMPEDDLASEVFKLINTLHNTGLQRGDRMSMAHGVEARVPFLDLNFMRLALNIPLSMKFGPHNQEKWVLRKAFSDILPKEIAFRKKKKFSVGAGSFLALAHVAEKTISDDEFQRGVVTPSGHHIKSKEEFMYYRIFREFYPMESVDKAIGFSRSL